MTDYFTDRSRTLRYQRCRRARFHEYHDGPQKIGIVPIRMGMHLVVGSAFHRGRSWLLSNSHLLDYSSLLYEGRFITSNQVQRKLEDEAVVLALEEFDTLSKQGLEADFVDRPEATELLQVAGAPLVPAFGITESAFVAAEGGDYSALTDEQVSMLLMDKVKHGGLVYDDYLKAEMRALTEALVRAWARRGLPRLLRDFIVLEVEREGKWVMSEWTQWAENTKRAENGLYYPESINRLWWMSRHDSLLLGRRDGKLVIDSAKTTSELDGRKIRDAQRDMQGLSESVDIERRLGQWWQQLHRNGDTHEPITRLMRNYLLPLSTFPRIDAVRYDYALKGERSKRSKEAKELSSRAGFTCRIQETPLLRAWFPKVGADPLTAADYRMGMKHSFEWLDELGNTKRLYAKNYERKLVWEVMPISEWIDLLDQGLIQPEARQRGALHLPQDVLAESILPGIEVQRNDDDLRDWIEQTEHQERFVIEAAEKVTRTEPGSEERRSALNILFPQNKQACSYPGECAFAHICFGSEDVKRDPMSSGKYRVREPNHPQEFE